MKTDGNRTDLTARTRFTGAAITRMLIIIITGAMLAFSANAAVTIDGQKRICVDGQPFFPVGIFSATSASDMAGAKDLGFNTVHTYQAENYTDNEAEMLGYLNDANLLGLKVYMGMPRLWVTNSAGVQTDDIARRVDYLKDSPALLAWYLFDEPHWQGVAPSRLQLEAGTIRACDTNHPSILVECLLYEYRSYFASHPAALAPEDILMTDRYPVFSPANSSDLSTVSRELETARALVDKPLWAVIQLFGSGPGGTGYGQLEPTWTELRNMTYQALASGAKGITYFTYAGTQFILYNSPQGMTNAARITSELNTLSPMLLSDEPATPPLALEDNPSFVSRSFIHNGRSYMIAVNVTRSAATLRMTSNLGGMPDSVCVVFDERTISTSAGQLTESVEPLGVRVYEVAPLPQVTAGPVNRTVLLGQEAVFDVAVAGLGPFSYQWRKDSIDIPGETNTSCRFTASSPADDGAVFNVAISGAGNTLVSNDALLHINGAGSTYTMPISFPGYNRNAALTNFPVLIVLSNNAAGSGFSYYQMGSPNGYDLRFKDAAETAELNYEIESWNTGRESYVWVQVPLLTNGTTIKAFWGDNALTSAPAAYTTNGSTWSNGCNYRGVWHFAHGTGPTAYDSTASMKDGVLSNGVSPVTGPIGGGAEFDGVNDYADLPDIFNSATQGSVSAWIQPGASSGNMQIYSGGDYNARLYLSINSSNRIAARLGSSPQFYGSTVLNEGQWYLATLSWAGSAGTIYLNGAPDGAGQAGPAGNPNAECIGCYQEKSWHTTNAFFKGRMDEVRVSGTDISSNWAWACYQTVAANSSFSGLGTAACSSVSSDVNTNGIPDVWEVANFGATNAVNGGAQDDWDQDGMSNLAEYMAGTSPTNSADLLRIAGAVHDATQGGEIVIRWSSVTGKRYSIRTATNLLTGFDSVAATNIPATPSINTHTVNVDQVSSRYYRVTVEQ